MSAVAKAASWAAPHTKGSTRPRFTVGAGGSFREQDAVEAVVGRYHELSPDQGTGWLVAFDPSFSVDPSAAIVIGRDLEDSKRLVVAHSERWVHKHSRTARRRAKTEEERLDVAGTVLDAVARLSLRYGAPVVTDQHSRRSRVVFFRTTARTLQLSLEGRLGRLCAEGPDTAVRRVLGGVPDDPTAGRTPSVWPSVSP